MKKTETTAFEALKSGVTAELRAQDEQTLREAYARLVAGKSPKTPIQFIKKESKQLAAEADLEHIIGCLADVEMSTFEEADELEIIEPTEESSAVAAEVVVGETYQPQPETAPAMLPTAPGPLELAPAVLNPVPTNLDIILSAAVPAATKTYSPLSHLDLINSVKEQLDKRGLVLKDERYQQNRNGQQMFGHMTVSGFNDEQDMCLGFRNSYDKTMQVGVVGGSRVIVCSNLMFAGDFKSLQMHQGNISQELSIMLGKAADRLEEHYRKLQLDSDKMKQVEVNPRIIHEILGELFYSESVVSEAQLRIIRGELREQTNFGDGSLWDIYNHTTEALKTTPSGLVIGRHIDAHQFYMGRA